MKRKTVFAIIGGALIAMGVVGFVLHALLQIEAGELGYRNYKNQPMTYLGALATLGVAVVVGIIGLYYRVKALIQQRSAQRRFGPE